MNLTRSYVDGLAREGHTLRAARHTSVFFSLHASDVDGLPVARIDPDLKALVTFTNASNHSIDHSQGYLRFAGEGNYSVEVQLGLPGLYSIQLLKEKRVNKQTLREQLPHAVKINAFCRSGEYWTQRECRPCESWGVCDALGTTIETIQVKPGYWRYAAATLDVKACAFQPACAGSNAQFNDNVSVARSRGPLRPALSHSGINAFFRSAIPKALHSQHVGAFDDGGTIAASRHAGDSLCLPHHYGPMCDLCVPLYYKRRMCSRCPSKTISQHRGSQHSVAFCLLVCRWPLQGVHRRCVGGAASRGDLRKSLGHSAPSTPHCDRHRHVRPCQWLTDSSPGLLVGSLDLSHMWSDATYRRQAAVMGLVKGMELKEYWRRRTVQALASSLFRLTKGMKTWARWHGQ